MKKKLILLILTAMVISCISPGDILPAKASGASVSISGPSEVEAGESYKYDITVSATAASIGGTISCASGPISGNDGTFWKDSSAGVDESLTATGAITITVSESASAGSTATISVSGNGSNVNPDTYDVSEFSISGSKTITVKAAATPKPTEKPTTKPTATATKEATPKPTEKATTEPTTAAPTQSPSPTPVIDNNTPEVSTSPAAPAETSANTHTVSDIWFQLTNQVNGQSEEEFKITINETCVIPYQLLSALKSTGADLVIETPSYKCKIKGSDIDNIADVNKIANLDMTIYNDASLSTAANNQDKYQLHFQGDSVPVSLNYTFSVLDQSAGQVMYLYYYNPATNTLEFVNSTTVADDRTISVDIPHYSSYILADSIISTAVGNPENIEDTSTTGKTKKTNLILLISFVVLIVIVYAVLMIKILGRRNSGQRYLNP